MRAEESPDTLRRARPGYHDPTAALGGAPGLSPLTLRLRLAVFGLVASLIGVVVFTALGIGGVALGFALIAVTAVVDLGVIQRRRSRGEPG